uniref:Dual specificity protein phosphatase 13B n=1 Tax=Macaca fascicularis TaxID=9541 RepID=A0A7N9DAV6_MACFA
MTLERQRGVTAEAEGWAGWPMAETSLPELVGEDKATPCPSILELEELLRAGKSSCSRVDEVWPNLFIGDAAGPYSLPWGSANLPPWHWSFWCCWRLWPRRTHRRWWEPSVESALEPATPSGSSWRLHPLSATVFGLHRMDSLQKQDLRRPKIHGAVRASPYQPPTLASLQRLLWVRQAAMLNHIDEVWPSLFLGDAYAARDKSKLTQLGITHVVNAAAGKFQVDTGAKFYRGMSLEYYGIEADDNPFFDLSVYFLPVARYIRAALSIPQGRVLVHCAMGISRSATLVLAFLMIYENMTLVEAIQTVQAHRNICPNSGFLRQLQVLDNRLGRETGRL